MQLTDAVQAPPSDSVRLRGRLIALYVSLVGLATLAMGLLSSRVDRSWTVGDWLINYEGGFVRRGLPGEAAWWLGRLLHLPPAVFAVLFYLVLSGVLLLAMGSLALRSRRGLWSLALLASPATLAFPILDIGAGFRKELIFLAGLALLLWLLGRGRLQTTPGASVYIAAVLVVGVLGHESLICYAPYFYAALVLGGRSLRQAAVVCAVPFALALGAAALCASHIGNLPTAARICSSLGYPLVLQIMPLNQVCAGGAIPYLLTSADSARQLRALVAGHYHYLWVYPWFGLLAVLPAIGASIVIRRRGFGREVAVVWAAAAVSFLGSLLLFYYAVDWGRWIYIHAVSLAALLLFLDGRPGAVAAPAPTLRPGPGVRVLAWCLLFIYATAWTLPHAYGTGFLRFGYFDIFRLALHHGHPPPSDGPSVQFPLAEQRQLLGLKP